MKAKDIRTKSEADLKKLVTEQREQLRSFRFGESGSRTRNVRAGRGLRKTVARALGELAQRSKGE